MEFFNGKKTDRISNLLEDHFHLPALDNRLINIFSHISSLEFHHELGQLINKCDSEIEKLFVLGFMVESAQLCVSIPKSFRAMHTYAAGVGDQEFRIEYVPNWQSFYLEPQVKIGSYRVDFLAAFTHNHNDENHYKIVVVECDGHDFHEKTKKQAASDKKRDRFLQNLGLPVLRFTGSEIWKDPFQVAYEVCEHLRPTG